MVMQVNQRPIQNRCARHAGLDGSARRRGGMDWRLLIPLVAIAAVVIYFAIQSNQNSPAPKSPPTTGDANSIAATDKEAIISTGRPAWKDADDPTADGWDTEVFASKAKKQLEVLGKWLVRPDELADAAVEKLIASDFGCEPLRPKHLVTVLNDQHLKIDQASTTSRSGQSSDDDTSNAIETLKGVRGLTDAIGVAVEPFLNATDVRFKIKVFRVNATEDEITTRQYFAMSGQTQSGMVEQHATWDVGWLKDADGLPRMRWLRVVEFEQTVSRQPDGPLFADCTKSVLGGNRVYAEQFLRGANHWFERIQDPSRFALLGTPGLAVGDVNGDGLDDLYVCQEAGLPNRLFIQSPDGTARDASAAWGVDWLESSRSALFVDLDNDGDQDLVVAILGGVVVAENDGKGKLHLRDVLESPEDTMSLSAVDFDMDGKLDLYVCGYFENRKAGHNTTVGLPGAAADFVVHDANNGGRNMLFRNQISNEGVWRFTDVTEDVGLNANNHRYSFAASWDDFDNDGDLDLYVANDYGRDHFYRNEQIRSSPANSEQVAARQFVDISDSANVENSASGMSITWGDYDRDGWMDVFVSNMWSSAGNRIAYQNQFQPNASNEIKQRYQRLARGNTLLRNQGGGSFEDRSAPAGIEMGRWAWGSHFVDLNNDGWEDLIVSNGYLTTPDTGDL